MMELREELAAYFKGEHGFDQILSLEGDVYRHLEGRRTFRWECNGRGYFIKVHLGVGWAEIFKNLLSLRLPVLGADNEYQAIRKLEELDVPTMTVAGFGRRGLNPARRESFLITDELTDVISLEDLCRDWPTRPPGPKLKRALICEVARMARLLHDNGLNHRDFYLCHFLAEKSSLGPAETGERPMLHLIDLHRVQIRERVPLRWLVKDLGGLLFSALDIGLTFRDYCRFLREYTGSDLRHLLRKDSLPLGRIIDRAVGIYRRDFGRTPALPRAFGGRS